MLVGLRFKTSEDTIVPLSKTYHESFFNDISQYPVMPGVLIMEALAQTAGVLELSKPENKGKLVFMQGCNKLSLNKSFQSQLVMTATLSNVVEPLLLLSEAEVDGRCACASEHLLCNWKLRKAYLCFVRS